MVPWIGKKTSGRSEELWDHIEQFAGYGFNKSHSAAYALIAYQTAYLKAHYPREFMAALLTCDRDNADKVIKDIAECREMGMTRLAAGPEQERKGFHRRRRFRSGSASWPSRTSARRWWTPFSPAGILDGPFESLDDFCRRVDHKQLNRRAVESLIKAGAIDSLGMGRAQSVAILEAVMESTARERRSIAVGQGALFAPEDVAKSVDESPGRAGVGGQRPARI